MLASVALEEKDPGHLLDRGVWEAVTLRSFTGSLNQAAPDNLLLRLRYRCDLYLGIYYLS